MHVSGGDYIDSFWIAMSGAEILRICLEVCRIFRHFYNDAQIEATDVEKVFGMSRC